MKLLFIKKINEIIIIIIIIIITKRDEDLNFLIF